MDLVGCYIHKMTTDRLLIDLEGVTTDVLGRDAGASAPDGNPRTHATLDSGCSFEHC